MAKRPRLLDTGTQEMWWCPMCGRVLAKPPKVIDSNRFHSWKCNRPMERAAVSVWLLPTETES